MEKSSNCFPSLKCLRKKSSSTKIKSSIRMPTMKEFLSKPVTIGTQTFGLKRNILEASTMMKSNSSHKSSIIIKRQKGLSAGNINESINLSAVHKPGFLTSNRSTFFLSKGSFDEIFSANEKKAEFSALTSRPITRGNNPFVMENEKMKIVPITPKRKRGNSYGSRPNFRIKLNPFEYAREIIKNRRVSSGQWDKDLEEINFIK